VTFRCKEAVLLIGFNRPELLAEVIERIRAVAPPRVYLAVDGPRQGREGEIDKVRACQGLAGTIDWDCEVFTLFRDQNLGCGRGVSGAITWFFEHEERGIILEDDILPAPDFFPYVEAMLGKYAADPQVACVTGTNFIPPANQDNPNAPRLTRVPLVWGWATWRRVWNEYDFDIADWRKDWDAPAMKFAMGGTQPAKLLWSANFDLMARHAIDTWDLQFVFACMRRNQLTVAPPVNLVENVGFRSDATHTQRRPNYLRPTSSFKLPEPCPASVLDEQADGFLMPHVYEASLSGLVRLGLRYGLRWVKRWSGGWSKTK
jgi:hypothetical protein